MTGYSTTPLQAVLILGFSTAVFGLGILGWVVGRAIFLGTSVPGFSFLASTIAIFAGVQLMTLGVIGEYLARMHFRVMQKPTYVVAETVGMNSGDQ
jgi:undecaprenyl-phosphate 4-deoxy-4-formamido-L-arabinose transferase